MKKPNASDERTKLELAAWRATHPDFRGEIDGVKNMLRLNPKTGGTELWPMSMFSEEELREHANLRLKKRE